MQISVSSVRHNFFPFAVVTSGKKLQNLLFVSRYWPINDVALVTSHSKRFSKT